MAERAPVDAKAKIDPRTHTAGEKDEEESSRVRRVCYTKKKAAEEKRK